MIGKSKALEDFEAWLAFLKHYGAGSTVAERVKSLGGFRSALTQYRGGWAK